MLLEAFAEGEYRRCDGGSRAESETPHQTEAQCSLLSISRAAARKLDFQFRTDFFNRLDLFAAILTVANIVFSQDAPAPYQGLGRP